VESYCVTHLFICLCIYFGVLESELGFALSKQALYCLSHTIFLFLFLVGLEFEFSFALANQVLYHLHHTSSPF
jgi:hypothetical protein